MDNAIRDRWCFHCQCFHRKPYPKRKRCRDEAEARGDLKSGIMYDMFDYN